MTEPVDSPRREEGLRIWHDPIVNEPPRVCPDCDEPWPCAERKRQRKEKREIEGLLRDALYNVTEHVLLDGREGVRYQQPAEGLKCWWVDLTYGEHGLIVNVHRWDGDHHNDDATVEWLMGWLP